MSGLLRGFHTGDQLALFGFMFFYFVNFFQCLMFLGESFVTPIGSYSLRQFLNLLSLLEPFRDWVHRKNVFSIRCMILSQYGSILASSLSWTKNETLSVRSVRRDHWLKLSSKNPMKHIGISEISVSSEIFCRLWKYNICVHGHYASSPSAFGRWRSFIMFYVISWWDLDKPFNYLPEVIRFRVRFRHIESISDNGWLVYIEGGLKVMVVEGWRWCWGKLGSLARMFLFIIESRFQPR